MLLGPVVLLYPYALSQVGHARSRPAVFRLKSVAARPLVDMKIATHTPAPSVTPTLPSATPGDDEDRTDSPGLGAALIDLLKVVAGALLALGSTLFIGRRDAASRAAGELHDAAMAYHQACHRCLTAWAQGAGLDYMPGMDQPLNALLAELSLCERRHPGWKAPRTVRGTLTELHDAIRSERWENGYEPTASEYITRLNATHDRVLDLVAGLEHPLRNFRLVRRP